MLYSRSQVGIFVVTSSHNQLLCIKMDDFATVPAYWVNYYTYLINKLWGYFSHYNEVIIKQIKSKNDADYGIEPLIDRRRIIWK